jgi:hypothetical protein
MRYLIVLAAFLWMATSCNSDDANEYPFVITVMTETGIPAQNVTVRVTADVPNAIPDFTGATDINGQVRFEYDNQAVLKVQASRGNPVSWIGCGFIRLKQGVEVEKTVVILPFDPSVGGC